MIGWRLVKDLPAVRRTFDGSTLLTKRTMMKTEMEHNSSRRANQLSLLWTLNREEGRINSSRVLTLAGNQTLKWHYLLRVKPAMLTCRDRIKSIRVME